MVDAARGGRYAAALAILSVSALLVTPFYFQQQIANQRVTVSSALDPIRAGASDVRLALAREVGAIRGYLLTRDRSLITEYLVARDAEERAIEDMTGVAGQDSVVREMVMRVATSAHNWNAANDKLAAGGSTAADALQILPAQLIRYRAALDAGEELEQLIAARSTEIQNRIINLERRWTIASAVLLAFAGAAAVVVILILRSAVTESTLARTDALTGLYNRRGFDELAERELSRANRNQSAITLLTFDIDGFKKVNDSLGHAAGDRLLRSVAAAIRDTIRGIDVAGRLGGDEFALLLPDNTASPPSRAVERVRDAIIERLRKESWGATLSVGAVTVQGYRAPIDEMIHTADALMYQVKSSGKNSIKHDMLGAVNA